MKAQQQRRKPKMGSIAPDVRVGPASARVSFAF